MSRPRARGGGLRPDDEVVVEQGDDWIFGFDGDDKLDGDLGNDRVFGGAGDDLISGGFGDDQVLGEEGNDTLDGSLGTDTVDGGSGSDICRSEFGLDTVLQCELVLPRRPGARRVVRAVSEQRGGLRARRPRRTRSRCRWCAPPARRPPSHRAA